MEPGIVTGACHSDLKGVGRAGVFREDVCSPDKLLSCVLLVNESPSRLVRSHIGSAHSQYRKECPIRRLIPVLGCEKYNVVSIGYCKILLSDFNRY
ncbi:unnamed protein product [Brassica oleracea]